MILCKPQHFAVVASFIVSYIDLVVLAGQEEDYMVKIAILTKQCINCCDNLHQLGVSPGSCVYHSALCAHHGGLWQTWGLWCPILPFCLSIPLTRSMSLQEKILKGMGSKEESIPNTGPAMGIAVCALHKTHPCWGWWKQYSECIEAARSERCSSLPFCLKHLRRGCYFFFFFLPQFRLSQELQDMARVRADTGQHLWEGAMLTASTRGCSQKIWVWGGCCLLQGHKIGCNKFGIY